MKMLIFFVTLVTALARANEIRPPQVLAQVASVNELIAAVQLNDAGILTVFKRDGSVHILKLSEANHASLQWNAQMLADVELEQNVRGVLCKMMLHPFHIQNLSVYDPQKRTLRTVLSMNSCALPSYIQPKEDFAVEGALELKAQLLALALQLPN